MKVYKRNSQTDGKERLTLRGSFKGLKAIEWKSIMCDYAASAPSCVSVDLANVQEFDLAALNALVQCHLSFSDLGKRLEFVVGEKELITDLLKMTRIDEILHIAA